MTPRRTTAWMPVAWRYNDHRPGRWHALPDANETLDNVRGLCGLMSGVAGAPGHYCAQRREEGKTYLLFKRPVSG